MSNLSIGIAGAGIAGRLVAMELVRQGHQVTLFDRDPLLDSNLCDQAVEQLSIADTGVSACSYTAAGMLTPWSEAELAEPLVIELGLASLKLWPEIVQQLGTEVFYRDKGTLVISHQQDIADFNRFNAQVQASFTPEQQRLSMINQQQLAELEPELAGRFRSASYAPDEAWLCSCCVMPALGSWLQQQQVSWHSHTQVLSVDAGSITTQSRSGAQQHAFDWAIDCRGLGAQGDVEKLRGVRGEILWLHAPDVNINRLIRLMHPHYRIYIVPRRDNLYLIGATQIESDDSGPITVRSSLELLSAAYSVHAGFGEAKIVHSDVNVRPAFPDNQPKIFVEQGRVQINGLFRHGYLMSPAIAQKVAQAIANNGATPQNAFPNLFQEHLLCEVPA